MVACVAGRVRIPNLTGEPRVLRHNEHFCQAQPVLFEGFSHKEYDTSVAQVKCSSATNGFSDSVVVDPDSILSAQCRQDFVDLNKEYDIVFDPRFPGYNGAVGPFKAFVNMGPVQPPQRKGRVPQYSRNKLVELQAKFDELEEIGVFRRPEDLGISVEYLNPSFLINKASGDFRLVTAFADVGRYSKPQPSLMPNVDSVIRHIGQWRYIIATDLTNAFYQIPLSKESMKYCGVATPFKGIRVYARSAMGMPGSETALEELMCRVLGDLLEEGIVVKLADDLYVGGESPHTLLDNWRRVLHALDKCGLRLSASKTSICPRSTTILGWRWEMGCLQATSHRINALATCGLPEKVKGLRSFIGAYKVLSRCLPHCLSYLAPLDALCAGRDSKDTVPWTNDSREFFSEAQKALKKAKSITIPRPDHQLWIVTDGAVKNHGIGATLYVTQVGDSRPSDAKVAGFFSVKLRGRQTSWLPCEVEALAISASVKHFSPYIVQSQSKACILTDSKPCVQAFEKLCRGEFSLSPRVSTFLSTVSRYQASVRHLAGSVNIPTDFASRNAATCTNSSCQICSFVSMSSDCVVHNVSV